jgi:hypothetical protein
MKKILALLLAVPLMSFAQKAPEPPKPVMIKPSAKHEKCMNLDAGQKLEYRFESAAKLNFSLSYRKSADEVYYPVKLDRTTGEGGIYEVKSRNRYCLNWDNRTDKEVELTYSTKVGK